MMLNGSEEDCGATMALSNLAVCLACLSVQVIELGQHVLEDLWRRRNPHRGTLISSLQFSMLPEHDSICLVSIGV